MQELGRVVSKYLFPIVLIALGIFLLIISPSQTPLFLFGGIGILIVGILGFLFVKGLISKQVQIIIAVVIAVGALYFSFKDYDVIRDEMAYNEKKAKINTAIIQRLKDIRKAQVAYNKENGKYTPSFDTLIDFLKNGEITLIKRLGSLPDSVPTDEMARELGIIDSMPQGMTDEQVIASGIIVRDTIAVPVMGYIFDDSDKKDRKTKFYVDSLPRVPYSDHDFVMQTDQIESGGVRQSVFEVKDPEPFAEQLIVGSLQEASTSGNWKE